jgi:2-polyprenyl-3-methyl-5-hydroxy-6-metoxy-1,4-benzoquinol methylase
MLREKVYRNKGNIAVLEQVNDDKINILDVGCGAGDNANCLQRKGRKITGITLSNEELKYASEFCDHVILGDIENFNFHELESNYDAIILSHVCEHLIDPTQTIKNLLKTLHVNGILIAAVPNMSFYKNRIKLLKGDWSMSDSGPFDRTHLHFYDYFSINELYESIEGIEVKKIPADLAIPLWPIRKIIKNKCKKIDFLIGARFPNLFCQQIILVINKV